MKVVMTLLVRNEEDILPAFLAYHFANGVDFIIATDNLSTDNSAAILKEYEREGRLLYIYEPDDNFDQSKWVTKMARLAALKYDADWVINSDADEFWWPENHSSIKEALASIDSNIRFIDVERTNFLPLPEDKQNNRPFWETMTIRDKASTNSLGHPLPPKVCHRAHPRIYIYYGNHKAQLLAESDSVTQNELTIFHFPLRSLDQFTDKIVNGAEAISRNDKVKPNTGITWKESYKLHKQQRLTDHYNEQTLQEPALSEGLKSGKYVEDKRLYHVLRTYSLNLHRHINTSYATRKSTPRTTTITQQIPSIVRFLWS
jgi:hypothetical protein